LSGGCTVAIQFDMNVIVVILLIPSKHDASHGFAEPLPVPEDHSLDLIHLAIVHAPVEKPVAPCLAVRIGVINEDVGGHKELGVQDHFSFGVKNVHDSAAQLRFNGLRNFDGPEVGRDSKDSLDAYDPDGTRVEVMEFTPKEKPCGHPYSAEHPKVETTPGVPPPIGIPQPSQSMLTLSRNEWRTLTLRGAPTGIIIPSANHVPGRAGANASKDHLGTFRVIGASGPPGGKGNLWRWRRGNLASHARFVNDSACWATLK
jgi:hypothetical protein